MIWGIITTLNTFRRARKLSLHVDSVMLNSAPILLIAFSLIFDIWFFQLSFDKKIIPRFTAVFILELNGLFLVVRLLCN